MAVCTNLYKSCWDVLAWTKCWHCHQEPSYCYGYEYWKDHTHLQYLPHNCVHQSTVSPVRSGSSPCGLHTLCRKDRPTGWRCRWGCPVCVTAARPGAPPDWRSASPGARCGSGRWCFPPLRQTRTGSLSWRWSRTESCSCTDEVYAGPEKHNSVILINVNTSTYNNNSSYDVVNVYEFSFIAPMTLNGDTKSKVWGG